MVTNGVVEIQSLHAVVNVTGPNGKSGQGWAPVELPMDTQLAQTASAQQISKPSRLTVDETHGGIVAELCAGIISVVQVLIIPQVVEL